jgi:hypothetical protein
MTLHLLSVTWAFPNRRQRFKKTIKVTVEVLELVLELCSPGEEEGEGKEIRGLPVQLQQMQHIALIKYLKSN